MSHDRSKGALLMAMVAIGLLVGAYLAPWFLYDFNSGRQTPPDGPQPESETGIVTHELTFHAGGWSGDVDPTDTAMAQRAVTWTSALLFAAGALLFGVVLGEIPGVDRVIGRNVSLALIGLAMLTTAAAVVVAVWWMPGSMAGYGVEGAYTARLDEPVGYTRAYMHSAWYLTMLGTAAVFGAGLFKFQAGPEARDVLRRQLA